MAVIETKGLTYTYPSGTKRALEDVSITIERGEFVVLTGPSGCGKTTLCRCFNGLVPHFYGGKLEGDVLVTGLNVQKKDSALIVTVILL
ncbi:ATP-binding cassette domain-containing protein, partial [Candidatus Bathyarchaeota archaeon]|nr:ATP-binding cassette domain-containing protein [Candidatus Bathyarchaeota archaeon]